MENIISFEKYLGKKTHQEQSHWVKNIVRFLIPFDLLNLIWNKYTKDNKSNSFVSIQSNKYKYKINREDNEKCKKYRIHIHLEEIIDDWNKMITIFDNYKIVFDLKGCFSTVYPIGENIEQPVYERIEKQLLNHEFDKLSAYNSKHFNDFLAMLLIQNIAKSAKTRAKYSYPRLTVEHNTKEIKLADSDNLKHQILYTFNKKDADEMVLKFSPDGIDSKRNQYLQKNFRHIVYFVNTDFENSGHKKIANENAESISIKEFMRKLQIPHNEWIKYELAVLFLIYNHNQEKFDWINNYAFSFFENKIRENSLKTEENKDYEPISESLFQDALNTLSTAQHLNNYLDDFQFLCAANLVNRKYNDILKQYSKDKTSKEYFEANKKMIGFKYHIFNIFHTFIEKKLKCMKICFGHVIYPNNIVSEDNCLFINMKIGTMSFQFRFRMKSGDMYQQKYLQEFMDFAKNNEIKFDGKDSGIYLQPIAQTLYQYSYLLKLNIK